MADNPVLLRRVRHARLPLDRATLVLWPKLMREWIAEDGAPEEIPLDREAIAERCRDTWLAQIDLRIPESQQAAERAKVEAELDAAAGPPGVRPAAGEVPAPAAERRVRLHGRAVQQLEGPGQAGSGPRSRVRHHEPAGAVR